MRKMITIRESILIKACKEEVWDFTQDFGSRKLWDDSIIDFKIVQKKPVKTIWVKMKGGVNTILDYKLCDKANKTSLKMRQTQSILIKGGGGSWKYTEIDGWTKWEQSNTLELKYGYTFLLFGWLIKRKLRANTMSAMKKAKSLIEKKTEHNK